MTATADALVAVVEWLRADDDVTALVTGRVYAAELPRTEIPNMPRTAIVVSAAGGGFLGGGYQDYGDSRFDVDSYGETPYRAWTVYLAVHGSLKHLQRAVSSGVLLHWAKPSSQGIRLRDPDTDYPLVMSSWQVLASEVAAA